MEMTDIKLFSKILDFISILTIFYICFFALGGKKGANLLKKRAAYFDVALFYV